eukprot:s1401_g10.t2
MWPDLVTSPCLTPQKGCALPGGLKQTFSAVSHHLTVHCVGCTMMQVFRYGIDITRHHLKGIYVVALGKARSPLRTLRPRVFLSLRKVKGFTNEAIFQDMFPIWTYARFPLLLLTGIFSEFEVVAGQGVLLVGAMCGFATVLLTLFGNTFLPQQIAQITVAANFASRFAVNAVIFQLASSDRVQQDVHTMKAVLLLSNAGSAILGEILRDNLAAPLSMLYVISAAATGLAVICSSATLLWKVNPAHGVALTYWQNLLKVRVAETDHNGYMLGASYLAAALVVGCEVCNSVNESGGPTEPRLALLFCVTGVLSGAAGSLVQHVRPISRRFELVAVTREPKSKATDEERSSSKRNVQVICTSREGSAEECEDWNMEEEESNASSPKNSLITLTYKGQQTTFRPWDPARCPLAASIHNRLIHFPIQPNSNVFAIFWSLNSLSHISDTLGPSGNLIAVLSHDSPLKPETLHRFIMRHKNTTVIFEDIKEASLERYTRLLSLPDDSRWAFLMALHPRLGANSPARLLKPEAEKICKIIFDFLVCTTPSQIKSLVMWQGQDESQEEEATVAIFDQALKHINILQHWRKPKPTKPKTEKSSEGESGQEKDNERIWVIMDMRTKLIVSRNLDFKLVNEMAKIGLLAKEQLALTPWFPDRSLLLCRYAVSRDERQAGQASASGPEDKERGKETGRTQKIQRPPKAVSMQVPSFVPKAPVREEEDMQVGQASATSGTEDKERKKEASRSQKSQRPPSAVSMPVPSFGSRSAREDKELSASMSRFQPPEAPAIQMMQDAGAVGARATISTFQQK